MLRLWPYAIVHVEDNGIEVTRREIPASAEATPNSNV